MLKKLLVIMLLILGIISVSFEKNEEIRSYEKGLYDKYEKEYSLKKLMEICAKQKDTAQAEKYYESGVRNKVLASDDLLIEFYKSTGEDEKLEKFLRNKIDKDVGEATGFSNSSLELGKLYEKQGKYDLALEYYDKAYLQTHGEKGWQELSKLERIVAEINKKDAYIKAGEAGDGEAYYQLALMYKEKRDLEKMIFYYQKGADNGNVESIREFSYWSFVRKDYKLAEKYYKMGVNKKDPVSMVKLGLLYNDAEKYDLAEKYYKMAIVNKNDDALIYLSKLYSKQGKSELAYKYYSEVIKKHSLEWIGYRIIELEKRPWISLE